MWWRCGDGLLCPGIAPGLQADALEPVFSSRPPSGTGTFAVLKAYDGDGCCRLVDALGPISFGGCSGEEEEMCSGGAAVVEDGDLCELGCIFLLL